MGDSDFATGRGADDSGCGVAGPTMLFTAAISGIFFTGADLGTRGFTGADPGTRGASASPTRHEEVMRVDDWCRFYALFRRLAGPSMSTTAVVSTHSSEAFAARPQAKCRSCCPASQRDDTVHA